MCTPSMSYDNTLFLAILLTSFHGLMCLGELTWPDTKHLQDYRKVILHNTLKSFLNLINSFYPVIKLTVFFKTTLFLFNLQNKTMILTPLLLHILLHRIASFLFVLNSGLKRMVLSLPKHGSCNSFITIFQEVSVGNPFVLEVLLP
jgi:hypothetical protein